MTWAPAAGRYDEMPYRRCGVSGLKLPVEAPLRRAGALPPGDWLRLYRTDAELLAALARLDEGPHDIAGAAI